MARASVHNSSGFVCKSNDFQQCLVDVDMRDGFKGYLVRKGATMYHGTACDVTAFMILQRPNFFAQRQTARQYSTKAEERTGCGYVLAFEFRRSAILLRMDLCSNIKKLRKLASDMGKTDVIQALDTAFRCRGVEKGAVTPQRYSKNSQVDLEVANFVLELGFNGFATKKQRSLSLVALNRMQSRGKTPGPDAYFHAELFLSDPGRFLRALPP